MSDIRLLLSRLDGVKSRGINQWQAKCPNHEDEKASLSITYKSAEDKILIHCHAGCDTREILDALQLDFKVLNPSIYAEEEAPSWKRDLESEYRYFDEVGKYVYSKLRYKGKRITYARINGNQCQNGRGDAQPTLYRLPQLLKAIRRGNVVFVTEGEKDVDSLTALGLTATTSGGVNSWKTEFAKYFKGTDVVLLPDNDEPGRKFMDGIQRDLSEIAIRTRTVTTSNMEKGDVTDWLSEGHSRSDLIELISTATECRPRWFDGKKHKINTGLLAQEILSHNDIVVSREPGKNVDIVFWYQGGVYRQQSEAEMISKVQPYIPAAMTTPQLLKNVSSLIGFGAMPHPFESINQNERYINVLNGLFDIHEGKLVDHDPKLLSTIQLNCRYNPNANAPRWEKFVRDLCTDSDGNLDQQMMDVLQEWTGFILSPIHGHRLKRALVIFSAQGNTGKSRYGDVITSLLGAHNVANVSFQEMGSSRWATGRAFAKRLIIVGDQGSESIDSSSVFKELTGGDLVSAELKGKQGFDYKFTGVVVALCNHLPVFNDDKGSHMIERLSFVDSRNVIPTEQRDPYISEKLLTERDGIFVWALKGLYRLIDNNYRFSACNSSVALTEDYRKHYDTLYAFISARCKMVTDRSAFTRKSVFENAYFQYCSEESFTPLAKRNIQSRAAGHGIRLGMKDGYQVYWGVELKAFYEVENEVPF